MEIPINNRCISLVGSGLYIDILGGIEPLRIYVKEGSYQMRDNILYIDNGTLDYIGGLVRGPAYISNFHMHLRNKDLFISGISCVNIPLVGYQCRHIDISIPYTHQMNHSSLFSILINQNNGQSESILFPDEESASLSESQ